MTKVKTNDGLAIGYVMPQRPRYTEAELALPRRFGLWHGISRTGVLVMTREQNRRAMMGSREAAKITDKFECQVEDQYRDRLLALPAGTRVTKGWNDISDWITANFGVAYDDEDVHSHFTVRCMGIVAGLCKTGFLVPKFPFEPETEFVRTDKPAPAGEPWE